MNTCGNMQEALAALKAGRTVLFPTDTVWGVGLAAAYAPNPAAIFAAKQRPAGKPVAWLVGGADALDAYGTQVPDYARNLAASFWPGPLTLVVRASSLVPEAYRSEQASIGLRMPASSSVLQLIQQVGPLATSSANLSGQRAAQSADQLPRELLDRVACVFDDGSTPSGIASTVVDCSGDAPVVLRRGSIEL